VTSNFIVSRGVSSSRTEHMKKLHAAIVYRLSNTFLILKQVHIFLRK
jgi:hypothetical protein